MQPTHHSILETYNVHACTGPTIDTFGSTQRAGTPIDRLALPSPHSCGGLGQGRAVAAFPRLKILERYLIGNITNLTMGFDVYSVYNIRKIVGGICGI